MLKILTTNLMRIIENLDRSTKSHTMLDEVALFFVVIPLKEYFIEVRPRKQSLLFKEIPSKGSIA